MLRNVRAWLVKDHPTPGYFIAAAWSYVVTDVIHSFI